MRGYHEGETIPKRDLKDVIPMRFSLIVQLADEGPKSSTLVLPERAKKDSTRGRLGTVVACGPLIEGSSQGEGLVMPGAFIMFDESVSIDSQDRCFDWDGERYIIFDLETVMGVRILRYATIDPGFKPTTDWRLLGDRVLVKAPALKETTTYGNTSFYIPDAFKKHQAGGRVVAVGRGIVGDSGKIIPVDYAPGDFVLFGKFSGTDITLDGEEYAVLRQDRILAKVTGDVDAVEFST